MTVTTLRVRLKLQIILLQNCVESNPTELHNRNVCFLWLGTLKLGNLRLHRFFFKVYLDCNQDFFYICKKDIILFLFETMINVYYYNKQPTILFRLSFLL